MKLRYLIKILIPLGLLTLAFPSMAEDGRLGPDSTSRMTISLSILPTIQIDTVSDIHLDIQDRNLDAIYDQAFCVTGNSTKYSVTAYGSTDGKNHFSLSNVDGELLIYSVAYRGDLQRNQFDILSPGDRSPIYDSNALGTSCSDNTNFRIKFRSEDLKAVKSGLYNGSLTFLVAPI